MTNDVYFSSLISGTIAEVIYGHKVTSNDDELIRLVEESIGYVGRTGSIGTTMIDLIPGGA